MIFPQFRIPAQRLKDDLINAGATWVDLPVVTDAHIVSARRPPDLPAFGGAIIDYLVKHPTP